MTRIVAGSAGSRSLKVPRSGTRPTSERVREALFSRLEHLGAVDGAEVLDLYAGSGALGLEAASRGAARVVLVEAARPAATLIRSNAGSLGLDAEVHATTVGSYLSGLTQAAFDLVLLDPPYDISENDLEQALTLLVPHLAPEAVVVVERAKRSPEPAWPTTGSGLSRFDHRTYGDTAIWLAEPGATEDLSAEPDTVSP